MRYAGARLRWIEIYDSFADFHAKRAHKRGRVSGVFLPRLLRVAALARNERILRFSGKSKWSSLETEDACDRMLEAMLTDRRSIFVTWQDALLHAFQL